MGLSSGGSTRPRARVASTVLCASWLAIASAVGSCGEWPPVVRRARDVETLPTTQREIRCVNCDDEALAAVARRFLDLDYLFVDAESRVTDEGVLAISTLRHLRQLELLSAVRLTDAGVRAVNQLSALEELSIDNAPQISSMALQSLGARTKLRRLFLRRCANADAETAQILRQRLAGADVRVLE
jgi:hypothetical protein